MSLWSARPFDPAYSARIVELADTEGLTRAELARRLGASEQDLLAWADTDAAFAVALADSDSAARAFWAAQPSRALATGEPFRIGIWAKLMAQRYGRSAHPTRAKAEVAAADAEVEVIIDLPDNGRKRRRRTAQTGR